MSYNAAWWSWRNWEWREARTWYYFRTSGYWNWASTLHSRWGNGEIATAFSVALGTTFGTPNVPDRGPYFAFGFDEGDINNGTRVIAAPSSVPFVADSFQADRTYATATLVEEPAPIPVPPAAALLLGGLGALGLAKRRRA